MTAITSDRASDIVELFRPSKFDRHVVDYRRENWLTDKTEEFAQRSAAVNEGAAKIIAAAHARRGVSQETYQRFAVSALVGDCEAIAASGLLPEPAEQSLRLLIAQTLSAFEMPAKADRARENA